MDSELSVLEAMLKVDVNFAVLRFAVDKKIGFGGRKDLWSGRGLHVSQSVMCKDASRVAHFVDSSWERKIEQVEDGVVLMGANVVAVDGEL